MKASRKLFNERKFQLRPRIKFHPRVEKPSTFIIDMWLNSTTHQLSVPTAWERRFHFPHSLLIYLCTSPYTSHNTPPTSLPHLEYICRCTAYSACLKCERCNWVLRRVWFCFFKMDYFFWKLTIWLYVFARN